jgi:hypothetical protein
MQMIISIETVVNTMWEWVIPTIVGSLMLGALLLLVRLVAKGIFRLLLKPRIIIRPSAGDASEGSRVSPPFFPTKKVTLWIQCTNNIHVNNITFRRICRYQRYCLLFRFFFKIGVLQNRRWCSFANVDDWVIEAHGFVKPSDVEKDRIETTFFTDGKLTLRPSMGTMIGGTWTPLDIPFKLSCERPHTLAVILDYNIDLKHRAGALQNLGRFLRFIGVKGSDLFRTSKTVDIDWDTCLQEGAKPTTNEGGLPEFSHGKRYIGSSYRGLERVDKAKELTSSLGNCIMQYVNKDPRPTEMSAWEVMQSMHREMPGVRMAINLPPDGVYRTVPIDRMKELLACWNYCKDFCDGFLNCTHYAGLVKHFVQYFAFFPQLLEDSFKYLCVKGHSSFADLALWLKCKENRSIPALTKFTIEEMRIVHMNRRMCKSLEKRTDKQATVIRKLGSK